MPHLDNMINKNDKKRNCLITINFFVKSNIVSDKIKINFENSFSFFLSNYNRNGHTLFIIFQLKILIK